MNISIIGAGNGGQALAGYLGLTGHSVRLFERFPENVEAFRSSRRITVVGAVDGTAQVTAVTSDVGEALDGAEVIVVTIPGFALTWVAEALAPHLRGGETILLHPGGVGGALEVRRRWDELDVPADVALAETDTLLFACRLKGPGLVDVKAVKRRLLVAALPSTQTDAVLATIRTFIPQAVPAVNVLETSLGNLNPIIHPVLTLTNAGLIERRDPAFDLYGQGVTPGVSRLLETADAERMAIATAFGVPTKSLLDWAESAYGVLERDLVSLYARMAREVYQGIGTPSGLDARYVTEDVPLGLVPMSGLGEIAKVPTPTIDALVTILGSMAGTDFRADGRDAARMGINELGRDDIVRRATEGSGGSARNAGRPGGAIEVKT